jgi:hypothetical protein
MPAGTVHVRVAYWADVVGDVEAVAKVTMHAPSDPAVDVTPVASSTVVAHAPVPTVAACAGGTPMPMPAARRTIEETRTVLRIMAQM